VQETYGTAGESRLLPSITQPRRQRVPCIGLAEAAVRLEALRLCGTTSSSVFQSDCGALLCLGQPWPRRHSGCATVAIGCDTACVCISGNVQSSNNAGSQPATSSPATTKAIFLRPWLFCLPSQAGWPSSEAARESAPKVS